MIRFKYIVLLALAALTFTGCEENDPLGDLGKKTGYAPTITMDRVNPTAAGSEFELRVRYWDQEDAIENVEVDAWALEAYTTAYSITVEGESFSFETKKEALEFTTQVNIFQKTGEFLPDWQTAESSYITDFTYLIDPMYAPIEAKELEYLESIEDERIAEISTTIVPQLPRVFLQEIYVGELALYDQESFDALFEEVVVEEPVGEEPPVVELVLTEEGAADLIANTDASVLEVMAKSSDNFSFAYTSEKEMFFESRATNTLGKTRIYNREISAKVL